ncbi:acid sphingomyelinase-like phosphodiesterase 3a [Athalia rosae]|uniref:acid sphingomyelinase-like phosphodiesterase 3a n=1 Tax=Athalia rosae TaxID=37344 RepID=UPI00203350C0|nr:acid sphingomyelinase-like phosphodiesterase 3a [Athalia rosae]
MSIPPGTRIIQGQNQRRNENDGKPSGIRVRKITDETPNLQIQESDFVWNNLHNLKYVEVINEFHDIIAGQFAGQRHEDSFRIVYDKRGEPVSSVLLAPAISPRFESYPAMRIYMYDKNSGKLVDFLQYYLNLTKANYECNKNEGEKYWNIGYSFRDYYRLPDATTKSLEKLVQNFGKDDYLFQRL